MRKLNILGHWDIFNKKFTIYGTVENPLFLAKEVAKLIEHTQVVRMIENIDAKEKVMNNIHTLGGNQDCWFLTEDGLYEVLMQSRKPIAKQFKAKVKEILKTIRKTGTYSTQQSLPACIEDLIIQQATLLKELRLKVESQEKRINDMIHIPFSHCQEFFTAEGWLKMKKIPYQRKFFWMFSRKCAKYSRDNNIEIRVSGKGGYVINAYREDVLERCFSNKLLSAPTSVKKPKKTGKNLAYALAEWFKTWEPEVRLTAIENFEECFTGIPDKCKPACYQALTTVINKIPEFIYTETKKIRKVG